MSDEANETSAEGGAVTEACPTVEQLRERARQIQHAAEGTGPRLDAQTIVEWCVPVLVALTVFTDGYTEDEASLHPACCGQRCETQHGIFVGIVKCGVCGAEIRDQCAPMSSSLLERGNSYCTMPSDKLVALIGDRPWLVVHPGDDRARETSRKGHPPPMTDKPKGAEFDREEQFCRYCGAVLPACCELMLWDGEPNRVGEAMCMRTGNMLIIPEWAEEDDDDQAS